MSYVAGQKLRASQMGGAYVCTSATRPAGHSGQMIYETDTDSLALYDGTNWNYLIPVGSVSTIYRAHASANQSIPNSTNTNLAFGVDDVTTTLVTKATSGAGHQFTLNRAGIWIITAGNRWTAAAGEVYTEIRVNGSPFYAQGGSNTVRVTQTLSMTQKFVATDVITINVFQSTGGALNTDTTAAGTRIALTWMHG